MYSTNGRLFMHVRSDIAHHRVTRFECYTDGVKSLSIELIIEKGNSVAACTYKHLCVKDSFF